MAKIKVVGKGDFGCHPRLGEIKAEQEYEIEEKDFAAELFDRVQDSEPAAAAATKKARA